MQDPLEIWKSEVPETSEMALLVEVQKAAEKAFAMCTEAFPNYHPLNYIVGQNRFVALQHRLLSFGKIDPVLKSRPLFHQNGMPFTQLYTPNIYLTTATVDEDMTFPQMTLLREQETKAQIDFLNGARVLICNLAINVSAANLGVPNLARIVFPDGHGGYLEPYVDLMQKKVTPVVLPVEKVKDARFTPAIGSEDSRNAPGNAPA
jgi:hypothetical protein